jgi:TatD DNase family protein
MAYSDSHAHLVDYRPEQLEKVFELMRIKQVEFALGVGVNLDSSEGTIRLAQSHEQVQAGVGIHPWFAEKLTDVTRQRFSELARSKYVKALGEIGLDYEPPIVAKKPPDVALLSKGIPDRQFPENMPPLPARPASKKVQQELLWFELSVALENRLPVNVHCHGGAHDDMMKILRKAVNSGLTGIAHGFGGSAAELRDWLDLGFYIALGNMGVTVREMPSLSAIIRDIPLNRLVTETDANPMMSPNGPIDVIRVAQKIEDIKGAPVEDIGNIATANLKHLLKL